MKRGLADTSLFIAGETDRRIDVGALPDALAVLNDSWIAATALALDVPVVTQDDDYVEVGGLRVVRV